MGAARHIALLSIAELLAMSLWFSATAVLPSLEQQWELTASGAAWLTASVQLGFVAGALGAAFFNLPDLLPPRRLIAVSAALGALANLALAWWVSSLGPALALRFATGACLAGVYPPGMKVAAGHVTGARRGLAIGALVGALSLGSATPHLIAGLAGPADLSPPEVLTVSSVLAIIGALLVLVAVRDGPHGAAPVPFDPAQLGRVLRDPAVRLANLGYCGHMWELYALWSWLAVFLTAAAHTPDLTAARLLTFAAIGGAGLVGATFGGLLADRVGRVTVTIAAMAISGTCCLVSPWAYDAPWALLVAFGLVWGASALADSAQFSAAVTELVEPSYLGTALTLQTCLGFALTMLPIWLLPLLAAQTGWQLAFVALAPGPLLGCVAMARLRRRPEAARLRAHTGSRQRR
ncbi:MAG: MFS transporter [Planctomycetota bacterium]